MARCNSVALALVACILAVLALSAPAAATTAGATESVKPLYHPGELPPRGEHLELRGGGEPRIVGGNATDNAKYPWQAQVRVFLEGGGGFFCGGTLIHPFIVITAAHCLLDDNGNLFEIEEVEVNLGRTFLESGGEADFAYNLWAPTGYNPEANFPQSAKNDVAFISLFFGAPSRPRIQIAGPTERALWTPGRTAFVTGWGDTTEGGELSPVLKEAAIPIIADETCGQIYGVLFDPVTMLCAGVLAGGTDSCQGDSGGPLMSPIDGGGFRLTGIVSWGIGCAQPNLPGVYTRIAADPLQAFIREVIPVIEQVDEIPAAFRGINVIGSGARPPGCGVAESELAAASTALARAKANLSKRKGQQRRALKALKSARRALKSARRNGVGVARAGKRLKAATRKSRIAKRKLAKARRGAARANAALAAAGTNKIAVCGA